ncbi:MAG: UDP-N-acetylmuramate dehydrogenase [Candidatus Omnitrophota bacterium]
MSVNYPMNYLNTLKLDLKFNEPLKDYTTFKIGGPAQVLVKPGDTAELQALIKVLIENGEKFFVLGCGSNLLISDEGFKGVVISLRQGEFLRIEENGVELKIGAGVKLSALLGFCVKNGFSGLEFAAGIPASVGGAVKRNAGIKQRCMADVVKDITYIDNAGEVKTLIEPELKFRYRGLDLDMAAITAVTLRLAKIKPGNVAKKIRGFFDLKMSTQPLSEKSAGCIFKNPQTGSAGRLIEEAGLKGKRVGGARVSEKHANFIINENNATAEDVLRLIDIVKEEVKLKKNIILQPEVDILA